MFRLLFVVLAAVGLYSLASGAVAATAVGVGAVVVGALLLVKILFIMSIVGFVGHRMGRHRHSRRMAPGPRRFGEERTGAADEDLFDEWHRLAHAREEVEGWVAGMPEVDQD